MAADRPSPRRERAADRLNDIRDQFDRWIRQYMKYDTKEQSRKIRDALTDLMNEVEAP